MSTLDSVLVVGASLAGHATARALRQQGFDGRLTLVGAEPERPYDRPPLSKEFLAGTLDADHLHLEPPGEDLGAEWVLGVEAAALDPHTRTVTLADGRSLSASAVVIATGSTVRALPTTLAGVHTLRTLADAQALKADLVPGARLVVVGAGFIGAEVAATAHGLGVEVTVVEAAPAPLSRQLGVEMGGVVAGLHAAAGVPLLCDAPVSGLVGQAAGSDSVGGAGGSDPVGGHRVQGVALADGRLLPADVVLVGIGASPAVGWLRTSGLDLSHGVVCDLRGATNAPGVWAVGDCSAWYDPVLRHPQRIEHWTDSRERAAHLVRAMLSGHPGTAADADLPSLRAPYFWSDQYGVRIQFAGHREDSDELVVEDGSAEDHDILATWRRDGALVAALGLNQTRAFARLRKSIGRVPVAA